MTSARPGGFEGHGAFDAAVSPHGNGRATVMCYEGGHERDRFHADRVLIGGGLPDESVDMTLGSRDHTALFEGVDVCTKTDELGQKVVWLAP